MSGEVFGHYRLERLIGRGGTGEVHRAYDTVRGRTVALKLLPASLGRDPEFRARFRREAQIVASLREGHVLPVHDVGEIDGRLYLDMRLIEGPDLATVLAWQRTLPPERAVRIVAQVAAALDAAHAVGLVHRDVKPTNILLAGAVPGQADDVEDHAYLVDFGIVHSASSPKVTATGTTLGTAEYMAPERFTRGTDDHRTDVYALGCVLLEMLTGAQPYPATELFQQMWEHASSPIPRVSDRRPGLPAELDDVVARALAKNPDERYAAAGELARAARTAVTGRTVDTGPPAAPAPAPPAPPRRGRGGSRVLGAAAVAVLVVALAIVGLLVWLP